MEFMCCTTCKALVVINPTGICLACQMGTVEPQEDFWINHPIHKPAEKKEVIEHTKPRKKNAKRRQ